MAARLAPSAPSCRAARTWSQIMAPMHGQHQSSVKRCPSGMAGQHFLKGHVPHQKTTEKVPSHRPQQLKAQRYMTGEADLQQRLAAHADQVAAGHFSGAGLVGALLDAPSARHQASPPSTSCGSAQAPPPQPAPARRRAPAQLASHDRPAHGPASPATGISGLSGS